MNKQMPFKIKGMQKDLSDANFNSEFAYENKNIRITNVEGSNLLSITNEKGNKQIVPVFADESSFAGKIIGQVVLGDEWIVFTAGTSDTGEDASRIYKFWFEGATLKGSKLYVGPLGFSTEHPIEALGVYENDNVKKVYWVDGVNQPRVINIAADDTTRSNWNPTSFDFVPLILFNDTISVTKSFSGGSFSPGVIQYAFTYYNLFSQETNIFYTTPLYYLSNEDRGAEADTIVNNSFNIELKNLDSRFEYVRIYSIHRSSIDAIPAVKRVADLSIDKDNANLSYTDTGTTGELVDPTLLLYIGGESIVASTINHKDGTLFLGNIKLSKPFIESVVKDRIKSLDINIEYKTLPSPSYDDFYAYESQLKYNPQEIKHFKYLDYYRLGVQVQHYTGKWSEPIWLQDKQMTEPISSEFYNTEDNKLPVFKCTIDNTFTKDLYEKGFRRIRPVIVYPTLQDREVLCQGVLCPTVYNVKDRLDNSPFSQSSWFIRPNTPFDIERGKEDGGLIGSADSPEGSWLFSRGAVLNSIAIVGTNYGTGWNTRVSTVDKGERVESRHNYPIPINTKRNSEIQCIHNVADSPISEEDINYWNNNYRENFYVDQSILTLHSPDLEFDDSLSALNLSDAKFRIVGVVPLTSFASDINISTSTPTIPFSNGSSPIGFYKEDIGVLDSPYKEITFDSNYPNIKGQWSLWGYRNLSAGIFWMDSTAKNPNNNTPIGYVVYPWHREGSLNDDEGNTEGYKSALLSKKTISNNRYSYKSAYLKQSNIWEADISGVSIFKSNNIALTKIPKQSQYHSEDISYYGNIDTLIVPSSNYPIVKTGVTGAADNIFQGSFISSETNSSLPVRMKYKSSPHAVLALKYKDDRTQVVLPTIYENNKNSIDDSWAINYVGKEIESDQGKYFWESEKTTREVTQDILNINEDIKGLYSEEEIGLQHGWLWLGELYRDNVPNRFGGTTQEALENNIWLPCGNPINIEKDSAVEIVWSEGDTYYQRYDHIKTKPYTNEDTNSIVDIISFMCETRVNIDGRYDRNRGLQSNLTINDTNFNLINKSYTQKNNFFNYRVLNPKVFNLDTFNATITWTKTKTNGELIDTWTNVTLASTLDLDSDKGSVTALRRYNNNLLAFQEKSLSHVMYNENVQIASTVGVPIEIANSGKVTGKRYISNFIGCKNKWSICESPSGIYFADDYNKSIYRYSNSLENISLKKGMDSWVKKVLTNKVWSPSDFNNIVTYYDINNKEVLFITKDDCLAYSEILDTFTSFYSYEEVPYIAYLDGNVLSTKIRGNTSIWIQNQGDYNYYFGQYKPFYSQIIVNAEPFKDKLFNTLEFRGDSFDNNGLSIYSPLNYIRAFNEYQDSGDTKLEYSINTPSNLKKKFRIWRANIPRDASTNDRMRNTWLHLEVGNDCKGSDKRNKILLHDLLVTYFD